MSLVRQMTSLHTNIHIVTTNFYELIRSYAIFHVLGVVAQSRHLRTQLHALFGMTQIQSDELYFPSTSNRGLSLTALPQTYTKHWTYKSVDAEHSFDNVKRDRNILESDL